jgi:hypothetical protein
LSGKGFDLPNSFGSLVERVLKGVSISDVTTIACHIPPELQGKLPGCKVWICLRSTSGALWSTRTAN